MTSLLTSGSIGAIAAALAAAQADIRPATEDGKGNFGTYATLKSIHAAIRDAMAKNGLAYVQGLADAEGGRLAVVTRLVHTSGEWMEWTR